MLIIKNIIFSTSSIIYPWQLSSHKEWRVLFAGRRQVKEAMCSFLENLNLLSLNEISSCLAMLSGHFGIIAENRDSVVAATDRVRGYPIFFSCKGPETIFSNSARYLRKELELGKPDHLSLLEILMAGYVTGPNTVYEELEQLQAGEVAVYQKLSGELKIHRYYEFLSPESDESEERLLNRLAANTEKVFLRVQRQASGRPVAVPLSGGLDSRLVLAMLKFIGVKELRAFSYGPPGNQEAARARVVAGKLGVPWGFYPSLRPSLQNTFNDQLRKEYWIASDGFCSVPNMQEYRVIAELTSSGELPAEAFIVNGQSGDFITGAHIPANLIRPEAGPEDLFQSVLDKHYSLWDLLKTPRNSDLIRGRFETNISAARRRGSEGLSNLYEYWEWQERQSKYVVNQQRTYDFFGLPWALPLWDREYCEFWREVPAALKFEQRLYRKFLERWDYKGVFTDPALCKPIVRWPGLSRVAIPLARAGWLIGGKRLKNVIYSRLKYFGHYSDYFGYYSYKYFLSRAGNIRNPVSLFAETWFREQFPDMVDKYLPFDS